MAKALVRRLEWYPVHVPQIVDAEGPVKPWHDRAIEVPDALLAEYTAALERFEDVQSELSEYSEKR